VAQITVLNQGNVPQGPFTREQVADRLSTGEFSLTDLAFVEGLAQWTPLRDVLARVDAVTLRPPAIAPPLRAPPAGTPAYSYAATMQPPPHLVYAGFWLRFVAYLIDGAIIGAALCIVGIFIGILFGVVAGLTGIDLHQNWGVNGITSSGQPFHLNETAPSPAAMLFLLLVELVFWALTLTLAWLYFAKLESGPARATYGKRVMGLRVTDLAGERIGFGRATGRFFGKFVSGLTFYIGFIMAAFTERKQALHDMIAGTLVVRN
jgi:uncharacterized RDD family membrane protein YckC